MTDQRYDYRKDLDKAKQLTKAFRLNMLTPDIMALVLLTNTDVQDFLRDYLGVEPVTVRDELSQMIATRKPRASASPISQWVGQAVLEAREYERRYNGHYSGAVDFFVNTVCPQGISRSPILSLLDKAYMINRKKVEVAHDYYRMAHAPAEIAEAIEKKNIHLANQSKTGDQKDMENGNQQNITPPEPLPPGIIAVEPTGPLAQFCTNMNLEVHKGRLDPAIGRDDEMHRMMQVLVRRKKNNPVLTGDAGVGKTATVEGLAYQIVKGDVPKKMEGKNIFSLDVNKLVAGTKYRGVFEDRVQKLLAELEKHEDAVLFIDEAHMMNGAGGAEGSLDLANAIKPAMASGKLNCILATTLKEFRSIEKDAALNRRVQEVRLYEPSVADTILMVKGQKDSYEAHHGVKITDVALEAAVVLAEKNIADRAFPDKAFDVIDETMAAATLRNPPATEVDIADIEKTVSDISGLGIDHIRSNGKNLVLTLCDDLKARVVNQDDAIDTVVSAVKRHTAGMDDENRPVGSFLFLGKTGVGKTELANTVSNHLFGRGPIRIDMQEYMEKHSVSRLFGAPPGYVGHDDGGQLTESVRRNPHSVVLFDEIEKAHPDVRQALLQALEDGFITDSKGKKVLLNNAVIIMTSNIQPEKLAKIKGIGFGTDLEASDTEKNDTHLDLHSKELLRYFQPEFLNRIDEVVTFHDHNEKSMLTLVDLFTKAVGQRLERKGSALALDEGARGYLADKGFDPAYGARPLKRLVQKEVADAVTDAVISGDLQEGMTASFTHDPDLDEGKGGLVLSFTKNAANDNDTAQDELAANDSKSKQKKQDTGYSVPDKADGPR